jgi:hypothetical protein
MQKPKKGFKFIPRTKEVINILKRYWKRYEEANDEFRHNLQKIEEDMQKELHEPLLEFFWTDGEVVGIGTPVNPKVMKLVQRDMLEDGK